MRIFGKEVRFIGVKFAPNNAYVGVYHAPSTIFAGDHFIAVSPVPFLTLQFAVGPMLHRRHRDPVSPVGWFEDGVPWGDQ